MNHHHRHETHEAARGLAKGLGWFSIALGLAELAAPHAIARSLGMRGKENLIQACGLREIATGAGILAARNPAPWLWGRVAGDGLDLATLGTGLHHGNRRRRNVQIALAATAGVTLLDIFAAQKMGEAAETMYLPTVDYSDRHGFPGGVAAARGAAKNFDPGKDFRTPEALRPWRDGRPQEGSEAGTGHGGGRGRGAKGKAKLGAAVERSASVLGSGRGRGDGGRNTAGNAPLQQAAGSHERDDAFKTGPSFTGKGNEGP